MNGWRPPPADSGYQTSNGSGRSFRVLSIAIPARTPTANGPGANGSYPTGGLICFRSVEDDVDVIHATTGIRVHHGPGVGATVSERAVAFDDGDLVAEVE